MKNIKSEQQKDAKYNPYNHFLAEINADLTKAEENSRKERGDNFNKNLDNSFQTQQAINQTGPKLI